ncbi:TPM domain-containing protein [Paraburkholderia bannensis]|uniref:TPM domain-containing protein n=1 Tax=Paraburkholderia bannensis TaxID=765414 RepID=UPI002AB633A2|nr:TPM domain-containing protein [Paraburkholderia bannensis]
MLLLSLLTLTLAHAGERQDAVQRDDVMAQASNACRRAYTAPITGTAIDAATLTHPQGRITDLTGAISEACNAALTQRLAALEQQTGDQLAVLLVPSIGSGTIEQYATQIFDQWKLGQKNVNNGILLVAAFHDHRVRIEVGYGLEGTIPDVMAGRIIRERIVPAFRSANYEEGISAAVDELAQQLTPAAVADASAPVEQTSPTDDVANYVPRPPANPEGPPHYVGPRFWLALALVNVIVGILVARRKLRRAMWPYVVSFLVNMVALIAWTPADTFGDRDGLFMLLFSSAIVGPASSLLGVRLYRSPRLRKRAAIFVGIVAVGTGIGCAMHFSFDNALLTVTGSLLALVAAIAAIIAKINGIDDSSSSTSTSSSGSLIDKVIDSVTGSNSGWGGGGGSSGGGGLSGSW